ADHRDELEPLLLERSTQTNEIRRCVALRLGLDHLGRRWPGPIALVEVGASAGLNLLFDYYSYHLGDQNILPAAPSEVVISSEIRTAASGRDLFGTAPEITTRLGIDQHPINLADPDARAWLEAFIWPEQVEDLATLRAAIDLALSTKAATVVEGDAVTDTAEILGEIAGDEPIAVFTASLLSYLSAAARTRFVEQLRQAATHRPVAWIFAEGPGLLATGDLDLTALAGPLGQRNSLYLVGASLRGPDGHQDDALLALADPYLRWLAPAKDTADDFQWLT
ncbi:MAG: DUF2332 family protein, partial [Acidimicrobiales bacterium]